MNGSILHLNGEDSTRSRIRLRATAVATPRGAPWWWELSPANACLQGTRSTWSAFWDKKDLGESNFIKMKQEGNWSGNFTETLTVNIDINGSSNNT